jgi:hypothetical protein
MLDPGVLDDERGVVRADVERDVLDLAGTDVEEERRAFLAQHRGHLVHQPGRCPDEVVLRALARERERDVVGLDPGELTQRDRDGALEAAEEDSPDPSGTRPSTSTDAPPTDAGLAAAPTPRRATYPAQPAGRPAPDRRARR